MIMQSKHIKTILRQRVKYTLHWSSVDILLKKYINLNYDKIIIYRQSHLKNIHDKDICVTWWWGMSLAFEKNSKIFSF